MNDKSIEVIIENLLQSSSEQSKSEFYELTSKKLYSYCLVLTKRVELADDLFHDTYIKAFRNLGSLKDKKKCDSWLKKIAKNLYLDFIKKSSTKSETNIFVDESVIISSEESVLKFDVISTLEKLSDEHREAIYLVDMEGMSYQEAAKIAFISEQAMKTRIYRARQSFIDKYNKPDAGKFD